MQILGSIAELEQVPGPVFIAVGVFDGVHLGHQALIGQTLGEAENAGGTAVALTFHPHPARILRPEAAPRLLTSTPHKQRLIESLGCPYLLVLPFDAAFAAQAPETFIKDLAAHARPLRKICVGHQWVFGRGRAGNVPLLHQLGESLNFRTLEIAPVTADNEPISSTRIRRSIEIGDFATAKTLLGRDYTILGTVQHGERIGTKLGFPTANLAAHNEQFPPDGVYAVRALFKGDWLSGVVNIGYRPTVGKNPDRLLEVHLFDFDGDLYDQDIEVKFEKFLRPEMKFNSLDELKAQIATDAAAARVILG